MLDVVRGIWDVWSLEAHGKFRTHVWKLWGGVGGYMGSMGHMESLGANMKGMLEAYGRSCGSTWSRMPKFDIK